MQRLYHNPQAKQKQDRQREARSKSRGGRKEKELNPEVMERLYGSTISKQKQAEATEKRAASRSRSRRAKTPSGASPQKQAGHDRLYEAGHARQREIARREAERREREALEAEEQARLQERWAQPTAAGRRLRQKQVTERKRVAQAERAEETAVLRAQQAQARAEDSEARAEASMRRMLSPPGAAAPPPMSPTEQAELQIQLQTDIQAFVEAGTPPTSDSENRARPRHFAAPPPTSSALSGISTIPFRTGSKSPPPPPSEEESDGPKELVETSRKLSKEANRWLQESLAADIGDVTPPTDVQRGTSRVVPYAVTAVERSDSSMTAAEDADPDKGVFLLPAVKAAMGDQRRTFAEEQANHDHLQLSGFRAMDMPHDVTPPTSPRESVTDSEATTPSRDDANEVVEELVKLELVEEVAPVLLVLAPAPAAPAELAAPAPHQLARTASPTEQVLAQRLAVMEMQLLNLSQELVTARQAAAHAVISQPVAPTAPVAVFSPTSTVAAAGETAQQKLLRLSAAASQNQPPPQRRDGSPREQWQMQDESRRTGKSADDILAATRKKSKRKSRASGSASAATGKAKRSDRSPARQRARTPQQPRSASRTTRSVELANQARRDQATAKALQAAVETMARHGPRRVGQRQAGTFRQQAETPYASAMVRAKATTVPEEQPQQPRRVMSRVVSRSEM